MIQYLMRRGRASEERVHVVVEYANGAGTNRPIAVLFAASFSPPLQSNKRRALVLEEEADCAGSTTTVHKEFHLES